MRGFRIAGVSGLLVLATLTLLDLDPEQRVVVAPICVLVAIVVALIILLWKRDDSLPYFDVGLFCVVVTGLYLIYPLVAFLFSGLAWTELSDNRLAFYDPTASEFARIGWWGVAYLASFAGAYALVRKSPAANVATGLRSPGKGAIAAMVALLILVMVFTQTVQAVFGVDTNPTYGPEGVPVANAPLVLQQILAKVYGIGTVLQLGLILLLVRRWDLSMCRFTLWTWAVLQVTTVVLVFGARSQAVLFLVAWLLAQQRLRPPLRPLAFLVLAVSILGTAVLYGFVRGFGTQADTVQAIFSASGEFQSMYGTAYNLIYLRDTGGLPEIPWHMYLADVLRPFPQQLLPFSKIDPSDWYLDLLGLKDKGVGFMFGVLSEGAIGFGAVELALRGVVLGFVFGKVHNWYSRNASAFWPTLFYLWLCVRSYYTYRASTFYLVGDLVLTFIPAYLLVRIMGGFFDHIGSRKHPISVLGR
jgi:hypothetical protein